MVYLRKEKMCLIEVKHLTKRYGSHDAVSELSFTIEKGGVTGFLGPNGAGKSTTMNIIAGCLGPTQGEVLVGGHDVLDEPMKVRHLIGYLPEQPPVYTDMTPDEYLSFVMRAKGVHKEKRAAQLREVMDRTRLHDVKDRLIANLSKGYRQRVGIAQALLGEPEVIILDEPTVGLDPKQIIEIRELIRELGKERTVVLSSHILSEVQAVCGQILILSRGKLVASDTAENLERLLSGTTLTLEVRGGENEVRTALAGVNAIESAEYMPGADGLTRILITPRENEDVREDLFYRFAAADIPILELHRERATLEDVFLELTDSDATVNLTTQTKETGHAQAEQQERAGDEA